MFPKLVVKRILTNEAKNWLVREVSTKEIKTTIFHINPDKAPGPDSYNAFFYKHNWEIIGQDVIQVVKSFFINGKILKQINHTFLTLIPKSHEASHLNNYRPISCCNVIYKIILKILDNRLKKVVCELVSPNQHAFLEGRQIGECSLIAHEMIRNFNQTNGKNACIKVDLQKAFDSINREFVYYIMHCMNFPIKFIQWIKECLSSPTFSILLNGSSNGFFGSNKGIRHGDPISPYIFVLVMEFWSIGMELASANGSIRSYKRNPKLQVTHLFFADDMLVFCNADRKSFEGFNALLHNLALNTGLVINRGKSRVFFSKGASNKSQLCRIVDIPKGKFLVRYLGLPLSIHYPKSSHYMPLIDKIRMKTEGWMAMSLSFAGRLELIKTVLQSTITHMFLSYNMPMKVIVEIERIFSNFLWNDSMHTMSWIDVCKTKQEGGFGIRRLEDLCRAATIKLIWRLLTTDTIWSTWVTARYLKNGNFWSTSASIFDSGVWKSMLNVRHLATDCIQEVTTDDLVTYK